MATAPVLENIEGGSIVVAVAHNPAIVLVDAAKRDDLYAHIQREIEAFEPDLTTENGRQAIKSFAFKITRTKTAIDDAGKKLNEEARTKINVVDAARRDAREKLDAMAKSVRQPLTEWEDAEKLRIEECRSIIDHDIKQAAIISINDTAEGVRQRGNDVWNIVLDPDRFGEMLAEAQAAKDATVATLKAALDRLEREEADRAELERLRAEAAERERIEADRRAEEERKAREAEESRIAEERRVAAEKAEAERIERARHEAVEQAQREADTKAERERHEAAAAAQVEIDAANAKARAAQQEAYARQIIQHIKDCAMGFIGGQPQPYGILLHELEKKVIIDASFGGLQAEAEQARESALATIHAAMEQQAARSREKEEQAKREADQAHRTKVKAAAKQAIMSCGADEETARKVVMAIIANEVSHVTLRF